MMLCNFIVKTLITFKMTSLNRCQNQSEGMNRCTVPKKGVIQYSCSTQSTQRQCSQLSRLKEMITYFNYDHILHPYRRDKDPHQLMVQLEKLIHDNPNIEPQSLQQMVQEMCSPFLELGFNIYVFYLAFTKAECASDYMIAIASFLKQYYTAKDLENVIMYILGLEVNSSDNKKVGNQTSYEQEEDVNYSDSAPIQPQSLRDFSPRKMLDNWKQLSDSELLAKAQRVIYGLASAGLVKQFNLEFTSGSYQVFAERSLKQFSFTSLNDLLYNVADLMVTFAETGYECFVEKSLAPVLVSDRISRTWLKRLQQMYDTHALINLNPNPDHPALLEELDGLIADGQRLLRTANKNILLPFFRPLMSFRSEYMARHGVSSMRRCPWSVLVHGPPGIGKTSVSMMIASIYKNVVVSKGIYPNLTWDPRKNLYNRNHDDEYWSGYRGAVHWCIMEDDLAKENPGHLSKGVKDGPLGSIQLVNTVGMATNQADLADKGKIPLLPKCVIANTNFRGLRAEFVVGDVGALLRRYPNVIEPVLKDQYKDKETGIMIKGSEIIEDAWNYRIETVHVLPGKPEQGSTVRYKPYLPGDNLASGEQLCQFLTESIVKHETSSAMMEQAISRSVGHTLCSHGVLESLHCSRCHPLPSLDPPIDDDESQCDEDVPDGTVTDLGIVPQSDILTDPFTGMPYAAGEEQTDMMRALWIYVGGVPILMLMSYFFYSALQRIHPKMVILFQRCISAVVYTLLMITPPRYRGVTLDFLLYWKFLCFGPVVGGCLHFLESRVPWEVEQHRQALLAVAGFCVSYVAVRTTIGATKMVGSAIKSSFIKKDKDDPPMPIFNPPVVPQGNIWNKPLPNEKFGVPPTTCIGNEYQLVASIKASIFRLGTIPAGSSTGGHAAAIHVGGGNYVTVGHLFQENVSAWSCTALLGKGKNNFRNKITFVLMPNQIRRLGNDLALFTTSAIIPRKSLRHFIPPEVDTVARRVRTVSLTLEGDIEIHDGYTSAIEHFKYSGHGTTIIEGDFFDGMRVDSSICKVGDCGTVVIAESSKGWFIKSMHVAGSVGTSRMISSPLSFSLFDYDSLPTRLLDANEFTYFNKGSTRSGPMLPPKDKSISLWCKPGNADHIGSFQGRSTSTTSTRETIICKEVCDAFGIVNPYTSPMMVPKQDNEGNWMNAYTIAANSQSNTSTEFAEPLLQVCAEEYAAPLIALIVEKDINVSPLTICEAINGVPGDDYINSLPMSTSGGFLFPGSKRNYFDKCLDSDEYSMSSKVKEKYDEIVFCYRGGERACVLFNGALKDEPVTLEKAAIGKTRVFTACDVAFSIVVRQYYARVARIIMEYNITSECAVSMNCYSEDWRLIYDRVVSHGVDRIIAGDYKQFDKKMSAVVMSIAFDVLIAMIMSKPGYDEDDVLILLGIKTDICWPITNLNGDVIQFFGGNSSGHPLTVIINSICNSLYIRTAFLYITRDVSSFRKHVALMTLGDDNVMGSNLDVFNHTTISTTLAAMGVVYTMPDKKSESVPFVNIHDVDFLKRRFVCQDGDIIAPLALDSVFKSLMMEVTKANISAEERLAQAYLTARREWSLHGKAVFDEYTAKMDKILEQHDFIRGFCTNMKYRYNYRQTYDWVRGVLDEPDVIMEGPKTLDLYDY